VKKQGLETHCFNLSSSFLESNVRAQKSVSSVFT